MDRPRTPGWMAPRTLPAPPTPPAPSHPGPPFRSVILLGHLLLLPYIHVCIRPRLEFPAGPSRLFHPFAVVRPSYSGCFFFFFFFFCQNRFCRSLLCDVFPACLLRRKLICRKIGLERGEMALSEMVVDDLKRKVGGGGEERDSIMGSV